MKRRTAIPSLVRIGSVRIEVLRKSLRRKGKPTDCHGDFQARDKRVRLTVDSACPEELVRSSFLHELVHAALYLSSARELFDAKTEEVVCDAVANALNDLIADGHLTLHARKDAAWKSQTR